MPHLGTPRLVRTIGPLCPRKYRIVRTIRHCEVAAHSSDDQLSVGVLQDDLLDAVDVGLAHFVHGGRAEEKPQLLSHSVWLRRPYDHTAQRCRVHAMGRRNLSRVETVGDPPLDDERYWARIRALVDILRPPAQQLAVGQLPRAFDDRRQVPARHLQLRANRIEVPCPECPGDKCPALVQRRRYAYAEPAAGRLVLIDDRDQLQVLKSQRHDLIGGPHLRVTATWNCLKGEPLVDAPRSLVEVFDWKQHMVDHRRRFESWGRLTEVKHHQPPYATQPPSTVMWLPVM